MPQVRIFGDRYESIVEAVRSRGLSAGAHDERGSDGGQDDKGGAVCAMEMVAWLSGEGMTDEPSCVDSWIATVVSFLNDQAEDADRQHLKLLIPLMVCGEYGYGEQATRSAMAWLVLTTYLAIKRGNPGGSQRLRSRLESQFSKAWAGEAWYKLTVPEMNQNARSFDGVESFMEKRTAQGLTAPKVTEFLLAVKSEYGSTEMVGLGLFLLFELSYASLITNTNEAIAAYPKSP
jgi:hypothetical protein